MAVLWCDHNGRGYTSSSWMYQASAMSVSLERVQRATRVSPTTKGAAPPEESIELTSPPAWPKTLAAYSSSGPGSPPIGGCESLSGGGGNNVSSSRMPLSRVDLDLACSCEPPRSVGMTDRSINFQLYKSFGRGARSPTTYFCPKTRGSLSLGRIIFSTDDPLSTSPR